MIAPLAALAVSDGSLCSRRCSPRSRRLRRIRRNDCLEESALLAMRFVGSSCRSAARTSRARIALCSRLLRRHSGTKRRVPSLLIRCSLRSLRLALVSRCLPHSLADENVSARSLVQDSGAPAWLSTAARDPVLIAPLAALAVSDGSLCSRRCSPRSRRLRRIRRNDCLEESALLAMRFVGSCCRSAARTSRARIAPGRRLLRIAC